MVFLFSIYFIGYLSKVYLRFTHQKLSIQRECYGLLARLISHSSATEGNACAVDRQRLGKRWGSTDTSITNTGTSTNTGTDASTDASTHASTDASTNAGTDVSTD